MKKIAFIFFLSILSSISFSQSDFTFKKIIQLPFGGMATSVKQAPDESYFLCGIYYDTAYQSGNFLMKLSKDGTTIWYREFLHPMYFSFYDLTLDLSGNIYISATGPDSLGGIDGNMVIIKTDPSGAMLWSKSYGGIKGDAGYSIDFTSDNNIIASGSSESYSTVTPGITSYTIKVDLNGNLLWNKFYTDSTSTDSYCVKELYPNKYVQLGSGTFSVFDNFGTILASKKVTYSDLLMMYSVTGYNNGGYLIAGSTASFAGIGSLRPFLMALDSNYNFLWAKKFVTPSIVYSEEFISINKTFDGNYIVSFEPEGVNGKQKSFGMTKLDASGAIIWEKLYEQNYYAYPNKLIETKDGGYMEVGFIETQFSQKPFIIKTNSLGIINGCISDTTLSSGFQSIIPTIISFGSVSSACIVNTTAETNISIVRLDSVYCVDSVPSTIGIEQYLINNEVNVYPNPVLSETSFLLSKELKKATLTIFNSMGERIEAKNFSGMEVDFNRNKLPSGMYFYTIDSENKIIAKGKLIFR